VHGRQGQADGVVADRHCFVDCTVREPCRHEPP
jgi:hypothetical protein